MNEVSIIDNWGVNSQSGITISDSTNVKVSNCIFLRNSYNNTDKKGIGGHMYIKARNISIENSKFSYSSASHGGAIHIIHYIETSDNYINIVECNFFKSNAYSQTKIGDGGAINIEFIVDQSSEKMDTIARITMNKTIFKENKAEGGGGAI